MSAIVELAAALEPELRPYAVGDPGAGRFADAPVSPDRAFVLEAVYEAYLLHYGEPRLSAAMDDDLRLLAGDALYATGLSRLAAIGDLAAVAELADLITGCAWARAEGRPELVDELWAASVVALGSPGGPGAASVITERLARSPRSP